MYRFGAKSFRSVLFPSRRSAALTAAYPKRLRGRSAVKAAIESLEGRRLLSYVPIDLSPYANVRIQDAGFSTDQYPSGNVALGGVPFTIASTGDNGWTAITSAPDPSILRVPVDVFGVTSVRTLLNTGWGVTTPGLASVEFVGSAGADYVDNLVGGTDIRDYNQNSFTNTINGTSTVNVFTTSDGQDRLDMQTINLPAAFSSQTLTAVDFIDNGANYVQRLLVAGLTVQTTASATAGTLASNTVLVPSSVNTLAGVAVTYTATVSSLSGGPTPTGSVTFNYNFSLSGAASQTEPLSSNGTATFSISSSTLNFINMQAVYSGDSTYAGSTSNFYTVNSNTGPLTLSAARGTIPVSIVAGSATRGVMDVKVTNPTASAIHQMETINMELFDSTDATRPVGSLRRLLSIPAGQSRIYPISVRLIGADSVSGQDQFLYNTVNSAGQTSLGYGVFITVTAPSVSLSATAGAVKPATIAANKTGTIEITVTNNGNISAIGSLVITLTPSADGVSAVPGISLAAPTEHVNLKPGKSGRYAMHFKITTLSAGVYYPLVTVTLDGVSTTAVGSPFTAG